MPLHIENRLFFCNMKGIMVLLLGSFLDFRFFPYTPIGQPCAALSIINISQVCQVHLQVIVDALQQSVDIESFFTQPLPLVLKELIDVLGNSSGVLGDMWRIQ